MSRQIINTGAAANDGTGDNLRAGGDKINANFAELYALHFGFRNRIRNATFAINQRVVSGTVTLAADEYGHDGVKAGAAGATYTFSTSGLDTTLTISSGSLILPIESVLIEGGTYVLSHAGTAQARVWQTSASGSYATVPADGLLVTGLAANTLTGVEFSTGTVLRPQFEPGALATPFERRLAGFESILCRRYFIRYLGSTIISAPVIAQGSSLLISLTQSSDMRWPPTVTHTLTDANYVNAAPGASEWSVGQAGVGWSTKTGTATLSAIAGKDRLFLRVTGATFSATPNAFQMGASMHIEASAEL